MTIRPPRAAHYPAAPTRAAGGVGALTTPAPPTPLVQRRRQRPIARTRAEFARDGRSRAGVCTPPGAAKRPASPPGSASATAARTLEAAILAKDIALYLHNTSKRVGDGRPRAVLSHAARHDRTGRSGRHGLSDAVRRGETLAAKQNPHVRHRCCSNMRLGLAAGSRPPSGPQLGEEPLLTPRLRRRTDYREGRNDAVHRCAAAGPFHARCGLPAEVRVHICVHARGTRVAGGGIGAEPFRTGGALPAGHDHLQAVLTPCRDSAGPRRAMMRSSSYWAAS